MIPDQLCLFDAPWCQRWRGGTHSWRRTSESGFNPAQYRVAPILADKPVKAFVLTHHYSGSYPAARMRYGLFTGDHLVGVAVLGEPMHARVLAGPFPTLDRSTAAELSRLVLLDEVPANAESWFVAQVFTLAAAEGLRGVVAFSDPMPRWLNGHLLMPGHVGTIYQALNAVYTGRGTARTLTLLADGSVLSDRSRAKVTGAERNWMHVVDHLVALGARRPELLDFTLDPGYRRAWLADAERAAGARKVRHRGNHRFAWAIGCKPFRRRTPIGYDALPYPKSIDPAVHTLTGCPEGPA